MRQIDHIPPPRGDNVKIDVEIAGLEKAIGEINMMRILAKELVKHTVAESTLVIYNDAIARTPVDTGNLENSWNFKITNNGFTGIISNPVEYAPHVEWGTIHMPAQPMLTPSYEEEMPH